jgi:hypothetical protein
MIKEEIAAEIERLLSHVEKYKSMLEVVDEEPVEEEETTEEESE